MKVFIDTGFFIAYFIKQEISHDEVVKKYKFYRQQKAIFITSDYILDELLTWFSVKQEKYELEKLITAIQKIRQTGEIKILSVDGAVFKKAENALLKFADHKISFTDATSYVLFKEFTLDIMFTLDEDFKKMRLPTSF